MSEPVIPFSHNLSSLIRFHVDEDALNSLPWKDFGNGSQMARLAREGETGLVFYKIAKDADHDAFAAHVHPGGELYLVLRGAIVDEGGIYKSGSIVWMKPGSRHTPRGTPDADTLIAVLWPEGVRADQKPNESESP